MKEIEHEIKEITGDFQTEVTEFCQELVRTRSVNGINDEKEMAELIVRRAKTLGLPSELFALDPRRPNVFIGRDFDKRDGLLFIAHLDTVPEGDTKNWKHDPFEARIEEGKLYGRGAIDCKAGIALSIYALKILQDLDRPGVAKFVGVVDEESGADSKLGARYLLDEGLKAKAAIYTYPGVDTVTIGHRGLVRLWVEVQGEAAHTGSLKWQKREKGANAITALAAFIKGLEDFHLEGKHEAFPGYSFTHTPTIIEGGVGESIVPDQAKVLVDARLLPNHDNEEYIRGIKALASRFTAPKIRFNVSVKTNIPSVAISPNEPIVQILKRLDEEVMGITPD